jgi:serine/threonine protein kinase
LTGENPFASAANLNELFAKIKATDFNLPVSLSPEAIDLIQRLLVGNPSERLGAASIDQIKDHPFFAGVDWTEMLKNRTPGPLNTRFNKDEMMLKALNVRLPGKAAEKSMQLKGFTYNENYNVDSPSFNT